MPNDLTYPDRSRIINAIAASVEHMDDMELLTTFVKVVDCDRCPYRYRCTGVRDEAYQSVCFTNLWDILFGEKEDV